MLMQTRLKLKFTRGSILSTIVLTACLDFACTSSRLANMWKDPEFKGPPMTNMLVVSASKSPVNRRIWEDAMATALTSQGVTSTPSYRLFSDSVPNPDQVGAAVQEKGFDGVLFTRRLPPRISTNYVPGYVKSEQVTHYNERSKSFVTFYRDVQEPGYSDTSKVVRHEVSVFATKDGGYLIWAGTGELIYPDSRDEVRNEITGLVIPELASQGIIRSK
jgi:hypothetical protein